MQYSKIEWTDHNLIRGSVVSTSRLPAITAMPSQ
jgi:hypothetical protein